MPDEPSLYDQVTGRKSGLQNDRYSWWVHAGELATYYIPRRYRWLVTPNQSNRGSPINGAIIDSTGTIAARTLAAGMMSGITSPTRPWFKLRIDGLDVDETSPANRWLAECERRMYRVFAESNFYNSAAVLWADLGVFGTAPMLIDEDYDNVIQCYNPCFGEYYAANNSKITVNIIYREITITIGAMVPRFGMTNVSDSVSRSYSQGGASLTSEVIICQAIEPNTPCKGCTVPPELPFRSVYWERDQGKGPDSGKFLEQRGYHEWPCPTPRWDLVSNDAYGRSPAMDALGDVKQLQHEQKRKAQAIDKMVNPPMIADVQMKNQPASMIPGGMTYVLNLSSQSHAGFRPAYEVQPRIAEMQQDIAEVQNRIRSVFFNDLFMMISQLQTVRTATEIDARREEKLIMLGPVLERAQNEFLDPAIERTFNIMLRAKLFPDPPPDIQGKPIDVEYVSMLAEAQKAVATAGMERLMQVVGNWAPVDATVIDTINRDKFVKKYGSLMAVDPDVMNSADEIAAIRQQRAQQQQQQQLMAMTPGAAKAAKDLSDTDVGGGKNALQAMLGQESVAA